MLKQEENLWYQKSRQDWFHFGNRSTAYFHSKVIQRRRHDKIVALKNETGEWVVDDASLKVHAIEYFRNLYTNDSSEYKLFDLTGRFMILSGKDAASLSRGISNEAIQKVISKWGLKRPKALMVCIIFITKNNGTLWGT